MNGKPAYKVVSVTDSMAYSPEHGTHRVKNVNLEMADGTHTYIVVRNPEYNAENVAKLALEAADEHQRIMALEGPPMMP